MSMLKTLPRLRFPEFLDEYQKRKVHEIALVTSGGTPSRQKRNYWNGEIPWVTTTLIKFGRINETNEFITQAGLKGSSAKLFPIGTVLMALYGQGVTRGKVAILDIEATTNQACAALIPRDGSLCSEFLFYELQRRYKELRELSNDGSQKNLSGELVKNLIVVIPFQKEQQKIADFLMAVDSRIQQLSQKKTQLECWKKGLMQQLFSQTLRFKDENGNDFPDWEVKRLGSVATFSKGKGISKAEIDENGLVPCIRYGELYTQYAELIDTVFSRTSTSVNELVLSHANDVIIPASGETHIDIATAACVIHSGIALGGDLNVIRSKENGVFLSYYLNNAYKHAIAGLAQGSSVIHLYANQLKLLTLVLPSKPEQTKIANCLSAIDKKIDDVSQQIEKTKTFKKGLLQQMFV